MITSLAGVLLLVGEATAAVQSIGARGQLLSGNSTIDNTIFVVVVIVVIALIFSKIVPIQGRDRTPY